MCVGVGGNGLLSVDMLTFGVQGAVQRRAFQHFELKPCRTEAFAREHLAKANVSHYYDLALSNAVIESSN